MGWKERFSRLPRKVDNLYSTTEDLSTSSEPIAALREAAQEVDPTFALEILLYTWDTTLRRPDYYRPYFRPAAKKAIAALHSTTPGRSRSIHKLASLVASCAVAQQEELEALDTAWHPGPTERSILLQVTGECLQTTPFARALVHDIRSSIPFVARRANGDDNAIHPSGEVMTITRGLPDHGDVQDFWLGIYVRLAVFLRVAQEEIRTPGDQDRPFTMLPPGTYVQSTFGDGNFQHLDIYAEDLTEHLAYRWTDRLDDLDLVTRPVLETTQGFVTSGLLTLDSIAPFALRWVHESGCWKGAISDPFEARVISELRRHGFIAGSVSERGHWSAEKPQSPLSAAMAAAAASCPGEIDAVSFDGSTIQIRECKSLYAFSKIRNLVGRVSDEDTSGWISNAEEKAQWLEDATGVPVSLTTIVIEGVELVDTGQLNHAVRVLDFNTFSRVLDQASRH